MAAAELRPAPPCSAWPGRAAPGMCVSTSWAGFRVSLGKGFKRNLGGGRQAAVAPRGARNLINIWREEVGRANLNIWRSAPAPPRKKFGGAPYTTY